jgi:bacillithiol system protein YtxJ
MTIHELSLESGPEHALRAIREASATSAALVFKYSPICPISHRAEGELDRFLEAIDPASELALARIDVIGRRPLARGLTDELGLRHESPQALWFRAGELTWHGSHGELTRERFAELMGHS